MKQGRMNIEVPTRTSKARFRRWGEIKDKKGLEGFTPTSGIYAG